MSRKIALLGDTHFSVRSGSKQFDNYFEKFFDNVFFPYLLNNNIKTVVQFGDLFDNRKFAHLHSLHRSKTYFFNRFKEYDIKLITFVGNHDSHFKNSIEINSSSLLLKEYDDITVIKEPTEISIYGIPITIIPWICIDNQQDCFDVITKSKSDICFGHFEIQGFQMHKGLMCDEGLDRKLFDKFEYVISGHFHHKSNQDNIYYIGTPYELNFNDESDQKGFYIFDLDTRDLSFIPNQYKMFSKLYYDDLNNEDYIKEFIREDYGSIYNQSYLKIVVKNKTNKILYNHFINSFDKHDLISLSIIDNPIDIFSEELHDIDEADSTLDIIFKYLANISHDGLNEKTLKTLINDIYHEAIEMETL